jgi:hypothetical protein
MKSAPAARETTVIGRQLGSRRTAKAIVRGASTPVAMINRNAIPWTQPFQVAGFPPLSIGTSTRNAAKISATPNRASNRETSRPPLRQLIAYRDGEDDDQQASDSEGRNLRPPVRPACQRAWPRNLRAADEFPAKLIKVTKAGPGAQPDRN